MAAMFRFRPTEVEIIDICLRLKITGNDGELRFIPVVDFFKQEPWQLPGLSGIETTDQERFCFSPPDMKQPNGKQFNRTTNSGFWKVTGKDKEIWSRGRLIGKKKILVFHLGSSANSKKTDWVMHEHHTTLEELDGTKLPGQKPYVFCRLFYKPKENSGKADDHPITSNECLHPENSDGMACDTTIATGTAKSASESPDKGCKGRKRKYTSKAGPAKSKRSAASASPALELQPIDHTPTEEFPLSEISDTIPSVEYSADSNSSAENQPNSFPNTAKCFPEEAWSDLTQASVSPASVQAEDYPTLIDGTTSDTRTPVECDGDNFNASSAENQVPDEEEQKMLLDMLQDPPDCNPSLPNTPTFSSPSTAKSSLEKTESELALASVSPALEEEADNHLTGCYFDGMTSNTAAPTKCNHNTCSAYTAKNQGAEATAGDQVGDSKSVALPITFPDVMGLDWGSILRSVFPVHSQKQKVSGDLVDDVPNYHHDGVPLQNGTNDPIAYISKFLDLTPSDPDESLPNDPSSQKTIAFDPRPRFMESDMDDGSHSAPNAKKLNALFYPTVQDSMRSVEINREAVSSGSYNDGGTSSIRSSYEFGY